MVQEVSGIVCISGGFLIGRILAAEKKKSMLAHSKSGMEAEGVKSRYEPERDFDVLKSIHYNSCTGSMTDFSPKGAN